MANYNEKFINKIEEITGFDYDLGIKMMIFKEKHTEEGDTKCICSHKVSKYYTWTFQDIKYKIGCDCVKKHMGDFTEEQIRDLIDIDTKYKKAIADAKKEEKKRIKEEKKRIAEEEKRIAEEEKKRIAEEIKRIAEEKKRIAEEEKEEEIFLLNKVYWKGELYKLKNLADNKEQDKLMFYYTKYDKFQNDKDKQIFKRILKKIFCVKK